MKKHLIAAAALILSTTGASAANMMMDKMSGMMQCSAACNASYMQCVMAANQMTSDPMQAGAQIMSNFQGSTACGQQAMACQQSCK